MKYLSLYAPKQKRCGRKCQALSAKGLPVKEKHIAWCIIFLKDLGLFLRMLHSVLCIATNSDLV